MKYPIVVGITGASGVVYGKRLLEILVEQRIPVHLTISDSGRIVLEHELKIQLDLNAFSLERLLPDHDVAAAPVTYHHYKDFMTPIASGSFRTSAMIICPCSGSTLGAIAHAAGGNLIQRAADVHLKEKRPLILVPRECPLSVPQIKNMAAVAEAGATVMPASPGFYHGCQSVDQLIDFIVARILDHIHVDHNLMRRWGE